MKNDIYESLLPEHIRLENHALYAAIKSNDELKLFMESHVFAVWDFMSLLKRLQIDLTTTTLPWQPSQYSKKLVRLINEIVLGEESDKDYAGNYSDHFSLYLNSMKEINADPERLIGLLGDLDTNKWCKPHEKAFVDFNLNLAKYGKTHEVAAAFFFGREKLIPDMFTSILKDLEANFPETSGVNFPNLKYYLERHIEIDGGEHSHQAEDCLIELCGNDEIKWNEAKVAGEKSLILRHQLWDGVLAEITKKH